ncbi:anti-sigma factor family protein [Polaromonas glacialis]|uniref:anti-sigma factor family protein n=1 Tax=Polaromonas glacialis TaxID=866564 RepID=UPI000497595E|nr:anti-sigma factor [Polaromonas glacialis]
MAKAHAEMLQDQINALVDGQLPDHQQAEAMQRLASNPAALETLRSWQAQREALRALHAPVLEEPFPESLLAAARRSHTSRLHVTPWWRWGGMAAAMVLAFGLGWLFHGQMDPRGTPPLASVQRQSAQDFMRQASVAHAVFSPEVRHPVEVTAAQQEHLVQWLSKRLGKPLKVPLLAAQGYELVGGRLLPGDSRARAQFMFQNPAGSRVTLYLGALNDPAPGAVAQKNDTAQTAFRYSADGPVSSFYWVDQDFGYALSGTLPREELMRLAQLVYQQL